MSDYPPEVIAAMVAEAERAYPAEGCGFVFAGPAGRRAEPIPNAVDRYHARDPDRFPRTSRTAYLMDPRRQMEALERADAAGERLAAVFHSHADVGAYFSDEDRAQALSAGGQPLLPGAEYLVLSVRAGGCDRILAFHHEGVRWQETEIALPAVARERA